MQSNAGDMRPQGVPEKFWDANSNSLRSDALLKAYLDLEKRMHSMVALPSDQSGPEDLFRFRQAMGVPESPEGYQINPPNEIFTPDPDINRRLFEAGFTPQQAQLVYDLAHERVTPMLEQVLTDFEERQYLDRLKSHFGGEQRWSEAARQLAQWGKANLPEEVYAALARTPDGVIALQKMMGSGEPNMSAVAGEGAEPMDEAALKRMMQDPRYWKKRDPAFIEKVTKGFERLS